MWDRAASGVLLVRSIEETDRTGALIAFGDREHASRDTLRELGLTGDQLRDSESQRDLRRALRLRAERLLEPLEHRHPVVHELLDRAQWPAWAGPLLMLAALTCGFALAALDGRRRIDILAFPFLGLIAWNLLVYVVLATSWLRRPDPTQKVRAPAASNTLTRWIVRPLQAHVRRTSRVHTALGTAVADFVTKWSQGAALQIGQRARRLFHLGSACIALGLLVGLYVRGVALLYEAGWDSTFLSAAQVRRVIDVVYALPSRVTGIALPASDSEVEALRWDPSGHGVNAARWIHLLGAGLILYIVLPRLALAAAAAYREWRLRTSPWSGAMASYARRVFGATARGTTRLTVQVVPYACELDAAQQAAIEASLTTRFGGDVAVEREATIAYGEEDAAARCFDSAEDDAYDGRVLLFALAATPESENHGTVIRSARDATERSSAAPLLLVVLDESAFAARFAGVQGSARRLEERRALWRDFVASYGLEAWIVDLAPDPGRERRLAPA